MINISQNNLLYNNMSFIYIYKNLFHFYVIRLLFYFSFILFDIKNLILYINLYFDTKCNKL